MPTPHPIPVKRVYPIGTRTLLRPARLAKRAPLATPAERLRGDWFWLWLLGVVVAAAGLGGSLLWGRP